MHNLLDFEVAYETVFLCLLGSGTLIKTGYQVPQSKQCNLSVNR